jgi:hypothetical protein
MSGTLFQGFARRLAIDNPAVVEKAKEIYRLSSERHAGGAAENMRPFLCFVIAAEQYAYTVACFL